MSEATRGLRRLVGARSGRGREFRGEGILWLEWLAKLRWVAIVAQVITLALSVNFLSHPVVVVPALLAVVGGLVVSNVYALAWLRHGEVEVRHLFVQLSLDVLALTVFFFAAGGPTNPFVVLYMIHVSMAALMMEARYAAALWALVIACYGAIHAWHLPLRMDDHVLSEGTLLRVAQIASFTVTVISSGVFVLGMASSLRSHRRRLLEARERAAAVDRLRAVGTLAAGAAHELNTPLSTIGLRLRRVGRRHEDEETVKDLDVIRAQLERCRRVVDQLLFGAGDPSASGIERAVLADLVRDGVRLWAGGSPIGVDLSDDSDGLVVELPRVAFTQALSNLLENARQAQEAVSEERPIRVRVAREGPTGVVTVTDRGCGLPERADRVGDPFFTTKPTGTGLGVYVARAVADAAGGGLELRPLENATEARWWFAEARRNP